MRFPGPAGFFGLTLAALSLAACGAGDGAADNGATSTTASGTADAAGDGGQGGDSGGGDGVRPTGMAVGGAPGGTAPDCYRPAWIAVPGDARVTGCLPLRMAENAPAIVGTVNFRTVRSAADVIAEQQKSAEAMGLGTRIRTDTHLRMDDAPRRSVMVTTKAHDAETEVVIDWTEN